MLTGIYNVYVFGYGQGQMVFICKREAIPAVLTFISNNLPGISKEVKMEDFDDINGRYWFEPICNDFDECPPEIEISFHEMDEKELANDEMDFNPQYASGAALLSKHNALYWVVSTISVLPHYSWMVLR